MKKLNQLSREHVWFAGILLFFVLACLTMKSCIWDEIQANQPAQTQQTEDPSPWASRKVMATVYDDLDREIETLERDMEALAHEIAALQEEIEQDIRDLQLIEFYLEGK